MATPADVIKIARNFADAGYLEAPGDHTPFGKWYGGDGHAWCAKFVSYCFNKAGATNLVDVQTDKGFHSCTDALAAFRTRKQVIKTADAQPGDIVFFNWDGDSTADHVGIVISNDPAKRLLKTVEGNTTPAPGKGDPKHEGVFVRSRAYAVVIGVVRPKWPAVKPAAPVATTPVAAPAAPVKVETPAAPANPVQQAPVAPTTPVKAPAATAPKVPAKAPATAVKRVHIVKRGETLGGIAKKYGTTVQALAKLNKIRDVNVISVGQHILLPAR